MGLNVLSQLPIRSDIIEKGPMKQDWLDWFIGLSKYVNRILNRYNGSLSGYATLVAGSVVVLNSNIRAGSAVRLTPQNNSGTPGHLSISVTLGYSFAITSTEATDTRKIFYEIVEAF